MLHRVVAEVFDQNYAVEDATSSRDPSRPAVRVISRLAPKRTAIIRASYVWIDAFVPELNVQTSVLDEGEVESEQADELRRLCLVMHAYLRGEGRIVQRRRLLGRGTSPVLKIELDGHQWILGRNHWSVR
ncbi:hypothetical protein AAZQ98_09655 [Glutamicibacter sp. Je.9.36]